MRLHQLWRNARVHLVKRQPSLGELAAAHLGLRELQVQAENIRLTRGALFFLLFLQDAHRTTVFLGRKVG